jgi:anaerobic ribonucleoside-triphosphate reductase
MEATNQPSKNETKLYCWDCQKELQEGEEVMTYNTTLHPERTYYKCKPCHQKDSILKNFQPCEVYSRVCGYIRPVEQWNKGKKNEFKDRKVYEVSPKN